MKTAVCEHVHVKSFVEKGENAGYHHFPIFPFS